MKQISANKLLKPELLLLIAINILVHWRFFDFSINSFADFPYHSSMEAINMLNVGSWSPTVSFGDVNLVLWRAPFTFLMGLLGVFGHLFMTTALFFAPLVLLTPIAGHAVFKRVLSTRPSVFLATSIFTFNTYFLAINSQGHLLIPISASLGMFALALFIDFLNNHENRSLLKSVLLLSGSIVTDFRIAYIFLGVLFLALLFRAFISKKKTDRLLAPLSIHFLAPLILLNSYWLLAVGALGSSLSGNDVLNRGLFGSVFWNINSAVALHHPFWSGGPIVWFESQPIVLILWIIPILATLGFLLSRAKVKLLWATVAVLGILLAKQTDEPFTGLYRFLFDTAPGFSAFREATKFYVLIIIGYAGLSGLLIDSEKKLRPLVFVGFFVVLFSAIPVAFGKVGNLYSNTSLPSDYAAYNEYVGAEDEFSRTLWVPFSPSWADSTIDNPSVSLIQLGDRHFEADGPELSLPEKARSYVRHLQLKDSAFQSAIKYVAVPLREERDRDSYKFYGDDRDLFIRELNELEWLERVNIETDELVLYRNKKYSPYLSAISSIAYSPDQEILRKFDELGLTSDDSPLSYTTSENLTSKSLILEDLFADSENNATSKTIEPTKNLLIRNGLTNVQYIMRSNTLSFYNTFLKPNVIKDEITITPEVKEAGKILIDEDADYYAFNTRPQSASRIDTSDQDAARYLGPKTTETKIYSAGQNVFSESFDESLGEFQGRLRDCNKYNDSPIIDMTLGKDSNSRENHALRLSASRHTACAGPNEIPVREGQVYRVGFDYKAQNTKRVGLRITFDDEVGEDSYQLFTAEQGAWRRHDTFVEVPDGSTTMQVQLLGFPNDELKGTGETLYDNFIITPASLELVIPANSRQHFEVMTNVEKASYKGLGASEVNRIANPSFEDGLWQSRVGDCNAYDDNPKLAMSISQDASEGANSLQLEAARHIACTSPQEKIDVDEGQTYLFQFDYRTTNGENAGYHISFNNSQKSSISERIEIVNDQWNTFSTTIPIPYGATEAQLTVYSYSDETTGRNIVTKYDNFKLLQAPDLSDLAYAWTAPEMTFERPQHIDFQLNSPTKKLVAIKGARTSFYLAMSEGYHPKWKADKISDEYHFELNGWQNGWFVDVDDLCVQRQLCEQNEDGSWDLELTIEFTPQKWFYVGSVISGMTFAGIVGYLGYDWRRGERKTYTTKSPK